MQLLVEVQQEKEKLFHDVAIWLKSNKKKTRAQQTKFDVECFQFGSVGNFVELFQFPKKVIFFAWDIFSNENKIKFAWHS